MLQLRLSTGGSWTSLRFLNVWFPASGGDYTAKMYCEFQLVLHFRIKNDHIYVKNENINGLYQIELINYLIISPYFFSPTCLPGIPKTFLIDLRKKIIIEGVASKLTHFAPCISSLECLWINWQAKLLKLPFSVMGIKETTKTSTSC